MKFSPICSLLLFGLILSGCSKNKDERTGIDPLAKNKAAPEIEQSFAVKKTSSLSSTTAALKSNANSDGGLSVDKAHVVIQKSALEKEFLLSVNMLSQTPTPMFSALQSRVVSFILRDRKVYLLDVTKNHVVASESNIPQSLLIAEFIVLEETENSLEIDFNSGMKQIFTAGDMSTSDDSEGRADYKLPTAQVRLSYLDEITLNNSALFIRQVAQLDDGPVATPVEVRYQIKPYLPDPEFVPVKSPGLDKVGYFEASPLLLADGSTRIYAMKWNEKKTIQFAVSANTPEKYRELFKSALLYFNKILGEKAVEVVQLEDKTQTAPRFDLNIIQWADWDAAGYAFADAHVDPRSGEVTSAQIFFPSAFMEAGVAGRVRTTNASRPVVGLKGFKSARLCNRNLMSDLSRREMAEGASPAAMDKAMRDYVYEVVAHEFGHVLGLRHNFAASLAANYDYKDRKNLILSYYKNMKAPTVDSGATVVASNSVMEYSKFEESAWNGDLFRNGSKALAYDEMAIKYLYFKTPLPATNRPLFCTDSDLKAYADCNQGDAGRSIISAASGAYQASLNSLAARLVNIYISNSKVRSDQATDLIPVSEVYLSATSSATGITADLSKLVSTLKDGTRFIAKRSEFMPLLATKRSEIVKLEKDYVQTEFTRLGGIESLTKELSDNFDTELISKFSELLDDPLYNSGVLADGTKYSFTTDEIETMKKQVALYAPQVKEQLILNEIKALSGITEENLSWVDSDLTYEYSHILLKKLVRYSLSKTTDKVSTAIAFKDSSKKEIELPVYQYPQNIRIAAIRLILNGHKAVDWGFQEKLAANALLEAELTLLGDPEKINMSLLDRNTLQWVLNNKKLISVLAE